MANMDDIKQKYVLHEETLSYLKLMSESGYSFNFDGVSTEEVRKKRETVYKEINGEVTFNGSEKEFHVPSPHVKDGIPVSVYKSTNCDYLVNPVVLVFFHGGGNVIGSRKTHEAVCKAISKDSSCIVVNVEYRMGPEHRFPANNDDAYHTVRWASYNKILLGTSQTSKLGVCGDNAGGRLAAVAAQEVPGIDFQVLIYPCVDKTKSYPSMEEFLNFPGLNKSMVEWFMSKYIDKSDFGTPRASPILYNDFKTLPPTLIIVAELDMLRDGALAYHDKLIQAGVESRVRKIQGVLHGFFGLVGHFKECCGIANSEISRFIREHS